MYPIYNYFSNTAQLHKSKGIFSKQTGKWKREFSNGLDESDIGVKNISTRLVYYVPYVV